MAAKDAQASKDSKDKDLKIEEARSQAAAANERAGLANERASALESANLQLRADLEKAVAESTKRQTELEVEQRNTAEAQKEAAEAQLALKKHLENVVKHQKDRELNSRTFVKLLEGKPKKAVELLYNPNDDEAYRFAMQIYRWLGTGDGDKGAGWNVSPPKPIPANAGYRDFNFPNAPPGLRFGGAGSSTGITFRARNVSGNSDRTTPLGALVNAIGFSLGGHSAFVIENDPSLPDDVILLVVGPKPPFWEPER